MDQACFKRERATVGRTAAGLFADWFCRALCRVRFSSARWYSRMVVRINFSTSFASSGSPIRERP